MKTFEVTLQLAKLKVISKKEAADVAEAIKLLLNSPYGKHTIKDYTWIELKFHKL